MTRQLPTDQQVRQAMDHVLHQATQAGRRPTVAAVERHLNIPHATFHRRYTDLITGHFQPAATAQTAAGPVQPRTTTSDHSPETLTRLRQENTDLRKLVQLYEEAIRQLTLDNHELHSRLLDHAAVIPIGSRTRR